MPEGKSKILTNFINLISSRFLLVNLSYPQSVQGFLQFFSWALSCYEEKRCHSVGRKWGPLIFTVFSSQAMVRSASCVISHRWSKQMITMFSLFIQPGLLGLLAVLLVSPPHQGLQLLQAYLCGHLTLQFAFDSS